MKHSLANKIVYIAGPLNGDVENNVKRARAAAETLSRLGIGYYCPHYYGVENFALGLPESYWIESGLEMLRRSDAVLLLRGWEDSSGTQGEVEEAFDRDIPVFDLDHLDDLVEYLTRL